MRSLTLLARVAYFKGTKALASANLIKPQPEPVLLDTWLSEEEVQPYLSWLTQRLNALIASVVKLSYGEDLRQCGQTIGALVLVAYACRLVGTTGFCFLLFSAAFSLPRGYELKKPEVDAACVVARAHAERLRQSGEQKANAAIEYVRQLSLKAAPGKASEKANEEEKKKL